MEIRRPTLKDKDAVLSMINEFLEQKSATDGLWHFNVNDFNYETWLEDSLRQEMGLASQGVPAIQYVAFDEKNQALGFLNLRLRLNASLLEKVGILVTLSVPASVGKVMPRRCLNKLSAVRFPRISRQFW